MSEEFGFLGAMFVGVVAFVLVVVVVTFDLGRHFDHKRCLAFGQQSGREVRFVKYNFWQWDCLVRTSDGKTWIPRQQLRDVAP